MNKKIRNLSNAADMEGRINDRAGNINHKSSYAKDLMTDLPYRHRRKWRKLFSRTWGISCDKINRRNVRTDWTLAL